MNVLAEAPAIPGPRGHFLLGSLPEFRAGMLNFLTECRDTFGGIVRFRLGPRNVVLVSEPEFIEQVLVTQNKSFRKHYATRLLKPVLGRGLLLSEGDEWLRQRRLIQPAFSRRFMSEFASVVVKHTLRLGEQWRQKPERDLYHDMTELTLQIAAEAFLGVQDTGIVDDIGDCLELIHSDFEFRFQQAWNWPISFPTGRNRRLKTAVRKLTAVIDQMIAARHSKDQVGHDVLSLLLHACNEQGRPMPRQLLRDEVMTMLLAGHDTTANTLVWTWNELARNSEVAEQLRCEVATAGTTPSHLPNRAAESNFALWVVKESMRLYPPVYVFGREAIEDVMLGDYAVHRGDSVLMSQWVVHRDERFFPDACSFRPERWSSAFERHLPPHAYFPFGGGPRICIGKEAALQEAVLVLSKLAPQFQVAIHNPADVTPWPTVTLRPKSAIHATVRPVAPSETRQCRTGASRRE